MQIFIGALPCVSILHWGGSLCVWKPYTGIQKKGAHKSLFRVMQIDPNIYLLPRRLHVYSPWHWESSPISVEAQHCLHVIFTQLKVKHLEEKPQLSKLPPWTNRRSCFHFFAWQEWSWKISHFHMPINVLMSLKWSRRKQSKFWNPHTWAFSLTRWGVTDFTTTTTFLWTRNLMRTW